MRSAQRSPSAAFLPPLSGAVGLPRQPTPSGLASPSRLLGRSAAGALPARRPQPGVRRSADLRSRRVVAPRRPPPAREAVTAAAAAAPGAPPPADASPGAPPATGRAPGFTPAELAATTLHLYNTMTRAKDAFEPAAPPAVTFYSCGPTVYDRAHIGNFRAFLVYDVAKRWLTARGYAVNHVMNLTDVDDKIIAKVSRGGVGGSLADAAALTHKYADAFFADLAKLNVVPASVYPRATDHIPEMEALIGGLRSRGVAYEAGGSTYFSVDAYPAYGQLARLPPPSQTLTPTAGGGLDADEYDRGDARDFALWKAWKPADGGVVWESAALGRGRPGWHIECTCMALKYLGSTIDIHGGGVDLVFPHHENERAQAEAATGVPYVRTWLHNAFVTIGGEGDKMSKSVGNWVSLDDVAPRAFRWLVVVAAYRSPLAFSAATVKAAGRTVRRLDALRAKLADVAAAAGGGGGAAAGAVDPALATAVASARARFVAAMDDDLNTPRAAAALFGLVGAAEKALKRAAAGGDGGGMSAATATAIDGCLLDFDTVFGIYYAPPLAAPPATGGREVPAAAGDPPAGGGAAAGNGVSAELRQLLAEREAARAAKDWARADAIRGQLGAAGWVVKDTPAGGVLVPVEGGA